MRIALKAVVVITREPGPYVDCAIDIHAIFSCSLDGGDLLDLPVQKMKIRKRETRSVSQFPTG
jgi:hypothetical protein